MILLPLSLVLAHLFASATGSNVGTSNNFIFPSNNNGNRAQIDGSFPVGTTITLQWTSIWESVNIVLFQDGTPAFQYLPNSAQLANATTFVWVINLSGAGGNPDFELSQGERFSFAVFNTGSSTSFESQYINITNSETSSVDPTTTTGSAPLSTTPPTSTSSALSIQSTSASLTSTNSAAGLSSGAKTVVGVGVSLGVVAIVVVLGVGLFFYRRKKATNGRRCALPQTEFETATTQPTELPEETSKHNHWISELMN